MAFQLSGIAIILFIAFGSMTFILLFLFAKRQIMRFALRSRRGPHVYVGAGAPKPICREIQCRLNIIEHVKCEPWLLNLKMKAKFECQDSISEISPPHVYRMKVVDDVQELCAFIKREKLPKSRHAQEDVLQYFVRLHKNNLFHNIDIQVLYRFLLLYEHARFQEKEFGYTEYSQFAELLQTIKNDIIHSSVTRKRCSYLPTIVSPMSEETGPVDESATSRLIKSLSNPNSRSGSINNFTRETGV